ncbi:ATP-binding protein [Aeribacillus sp. FSL K6-8394]|uniref:ATP-binding protein n=1 Tax=Aeribacillus sp. FSL K6-8394 TaxID=2954570 RepID=UPI0030F6E7DE
MEFTTVLNLLGLHRVEHLLFKCRPELVGKIENVEMKHEKCIKCGRPNVFKWYFTFISEDKQDSYCVSEICSNCMKGKYSKEITQELENRKKQLILNKWYRIDEDDACGFKNYETYNKITKNALDTAMKYTKTIINEQTKNLLIMGSTGTGKTHLAKTIAKTAKSKGIKTAYIESVDLFGLIKQTFGNDTNYQRFYEEFKSFDVMVIDDVGLETNKQADISWHVNEWTKLVNARKGKSTVYTTNFDDITLPEVVGKRASSRMYEKSDFIDLFTDDYRKKRLRQEGDGNV